MFKKFFNKLKKDILVYIAILAGAIAISYFSINLANKPKNEETILIFLGSHSTTGNSLKDALNNKKPSYLREINVSAFSVDDTVNFQTYYSAIGYEIADIIIIPESQAKAVVCHTYYARLTDEDIATNYKDEKILDFAFDEQNVFHYGIRIHAKGNDISKSPIKYYEDVKDDEDYYAFIRKNSIHAGLYSKSQYDTATIFIKEMALWE